MSKDLSNKDIFYLNKEDNYFYLHPEGAEILKQNLSTRYNILLDDNKDIVFRPIINSEIIYHYCGQQNLHNIAKSKSIWLRSALNMNDSEEIIWAVKKLDILFQEARLTNWDNGIWDNGKQAAINLLKKNNLYNDLNEKEINQRYDEINKLTPQERNENINQLINFLSNEINKGIIENLNPVYISSFSFEGDKLSQWRGYGDDGRGISIGFKKSSFQNNTLGICLRDVVYHHEHQVAIINNALAKFLTDTQSIKDWLPNILATFKPLAYKEENECRLILISNRTTLQKEINLSANKIDGHYAFPLTSDCIAEIIIGPKNKTDPEHIFLFLRHCGFEIEENQIKKSSLSYQ